MNVLVALCVFLTPCVLVRSEDIELLMHPEEEDDGSFSPDQATFRQVVSLNSVTFPGNVINSRYVKNWIVLYCVPWFERCAELQPSFNELASKVHRERNGQFQMLSSNVRFAQVDCAKNKPLCNAMNIDTYPVIMHYHDQRQSRWSGGVGQTDSNRRVKISLADWVEKRLDDPSVQQAPIGLVAAWQGLDEDTRNLLGGLACVCVLVFSLTKCVDQFTQLAKLQVEQQRKMQEMSSGKPAAAFLTAAPMVPIQPVVSSSQASATSGQLIDLDALVATPTPSASAPPSRLPAVPASLEL